MFTARYELIPYIKQITFSLQKVKVAGSQKEIEVPGIFNRVHLIYILPTVRSFVGFHRALNSHDITANNTSKQHANDTLPNTKQQGSKAAGSQTYFRNMRQTNSRFISALSPFSAFLVSFSPLVDYSNASFILRVIWDCNVSFGLGNDGWIHVEHWRDVTGWRKQNRSTGINKASGWTNNAEMIRVG